MTVAPRRAASSAETKALAHPVRIRILQAIGSGALTNSELARQLRLTPGTTLFHVRKLREQGFVEVMDERRGQRGARELPYRSTGKSWHLSFKKSGFTAQIAVGTALIASSVERYWQADPADRFGETSVTLRLNRQAESELQSRMHALISEYRKHEADEDSETIGVFWAMHRT